MKTHLQIPEPDAMFVPFDTDKDILGFTESHFYGGYEVYIMRPSERITIYHGSRHMCSMIYWDIVKRVSVRLGYQPADEETEIPQENLMDTLEKHWRH